VEGKATEVLSDMLCSTAKECWRARPIPIAIASFHLRWFFDFPVISVFFLFFFLFVGHISYLYDRPQKGVGSPADVVV